MRASRRPGRPRVLGAGAVGGHRPTISVLLPCRNAATFLQQSLDSLSAQTFGDFEVVAVDDGSTDETAAILERWARARPGVRLVERAPEGIVRALSHAASLACGDYLARIDADDVSHPERFSVQTSLLRAHPELAGCGTGVRYVPRRALGTGMLRYEAWLNRQRTAADVARDRFVECPVAHPTLMMRRGAFERLGGYQDRGWPEDYDLVLRAHAAGLAFGNADRVLHDWRMHPGRLSTRSPRYSRESFLACKLHYLAGALPGERPFVVWGAGSVGKRFGRAWLNRSGATPDANERFVAWVDLDPRKIGQEIHGRPVWSPEGMSRLERPRPYVLIAVGSPGARDEIRAALQDRGLEEGVDFRAVA